MDESEHLTHSLFKSKVWINQDITRPPKGTAQIFEIEKNVRN